VASSTNPALPAGLAHASPRAAALVEQLQTEASRANRDGAACLATLEKMMLNCISHPEEPKFRRLRRANAALQLAVLGVPRAEELLRLFGFVDAEDDALELPAGAGDAAVAAAVGLANDAIAALQAQRQGELGEVARVRRERETAAAAARAREADARITDERRAMLEKAKARHAVEAKEREELRRRIEEDNEERARRVAAQNKMLARAAKSPGGGVPSGAGTGAGAGAGAAAAVKTLKDLPQAPKSS